MLKSLSLSLLFSLIVLFNLNACQTITNTDFDQAPITYSTFTEQSGWQIWQLDLQNNQTQQLTNSENEAYYPALSASGLLVFSDHNGQIWLLRSNKKNHEQQTPELISSLPKYCGHPAISPNGKRLVCACFTFINRSEDSDLYLVDLETGHSDRLINLPGLQKHPAWSPDSKQIVFSSGYRERGEKIIEQLWQMNLANKVPVKIVDNGHSNIHPAWSPDGKQIAYSSDVNGSLDIWLYNMSGKHSIPITDLPVLESDPAWRPDGDALVYVSTREGTMSLWEIDLNTKQEQKLLSLPEDIHEPVWHQGQ